MEVTKEALRKIFRNEVIRKIGILLISVMIGMKSQTLYKNYKHSCDFEPHLNQYNGLSISIATPVNSDNLYINYLNPDSTVSVVLTNRSANPIGLWREWCSWGYFNLSFEVTDQFGKKYVVKKAGIAWTRNWPDKLIVKPEETLVFNVNLGSNIWKDKPCLTKNEKATMKIKAIYENEGYEFSPFSSGFSNGQYLWVGKVVSKEYDCVFYN